jgi:hypothetical protein
MRRILVLLTYVLFMVGCAEMPSTDLPRATDIFIMPSLVPAPVSNPIENWGMRWMNNEPCQAPCWENLTPGVTTVDESMLLLMDSPINWVRYLPKDNSISFEWRNKDNIYYSGYIELNSLVSPAVVKSIRLDVLSNNVGLELKNILTSFGEPQISFTGRCAPVALYSLDVYFPEYNTLFFIFDADSSIRLSPSLSFSSVLFSENINTSYQVWDDWQGYSAEYNIRKTVSSFQHNFQDSFDYSICSEPSS